MNVNDYKKIPFRDTINTVLQYLNTYEILTNVNSPNAFCLGKNCKHYSVAIKIELYNDSITIRYYNDEHITESKIDFGTHKDGYLYFFYGIFDDETYNADDYTSSILEIKTFKYCSTEAEYFQESTIYDYEGITMQDMNSAVQLFDSIRARIKEKI